MCQVAALLGQGKFPFSIAAGNMDMRDHLNLLCCVDNVLIMSLPIVVNTSFLVHWPTSLRSIEGDTSRVVSNWD